MLEARDAWSEVSKRNDPNELSVLIRDVAHNYTETKCPVMTLVDSMVNVVTIEQGERESMASFEDRFKNTFDVMMRRLGGLSMKELCKIDNPDFDGMKDEDKEKLEKEKFKEFQAYLYLKGGSKKSTDLIRVLNNDFAKKQNNFPKTVPAARTLMSNHKAQKKEKSGRTEPPATNEEKAVGFAQGGKKLSIAEMKQKDPCKACGLTGHWHKDKVCKLNPNNPDYKPPTGAVNVQSGTTEDQQEPKKNAFAMCQPCAVVTAATQVSFLEKDAWGDLKNMLLLDNQSTADLVCQRQYLKNIRTVSETLHLGTNGGDAIARHKTELPGYKV